MSEGGMCSMAQATSTGSLFKFMLTIVLSGYWATQKVPGGDADWFKFLHGVVGASPEPQIGKKKDNRLKYGKNDAIN